ncbi:MAG TPA: hypothetical protein DDZ92_04025 [Halomonas sp.]|nr:hypothetical protein [Halomonas sp.]|tara:strand:+ start:613 stop:828 length:216 start_codon:yes stop_codon:yes gene_type:complete
MTTATLVIELRPGERLTSFEAAVAELANQLGTNLQRSDDPRYPCTYYMRQRYAPSNVIPMRRKGAIKGVSS